ncbi:hypothetical protein C9374_002858 [Naegleria lovaniensis]|uniref:PPIase cyclophilin-type domain-containing protein n=1 Tax=Naegleria lovaniensis TaxID=51637 RepID=A0AA88KQG2_NAELO|nr:uncharacterized protein C9374_002858 [Naegleria lovaniensis]KAG2386412.1 hypothetical protein C9374_002858 [Naegleria lovaniensis]
MDSRMSFSETGSSQKHYVNGDDDLLIIDNIKKEVVKLPEDVAQENKDHPNNAEEEWPRIDDDENGSRVLIVRRSSTSASPTPFTQSESDGETSGDLKSSSSPLQLHTLQLSTTITTRSSHESLSPSSGGVLTIGHYGHGGTGHSPNQGSTDCSSRQQQSASSTQRRRASPNPPNGCGGTLSCLKDDFIILYKIFTFLRFKDLIRVSNVSSYWRKILRDAALNNCSNESHIRKTIMKQEFTDLYERECRRLWPFNCDVSRYPKQSQPNTNNSNSENPVPIIIRQDEDDDQIQNRPSILELDVGGYRAMLIDENSENELFPFVMLKFAKMSRKRYLNFVAACSSSSLDTSNSGIMDIGTVEIKLDKKHAAKAAENFRCLCTGEKGLSSRSIPLTLKGSTIHKSIQATLIQGGDIEYSGTSGWWKCHNYFGKDCSSPSSHSNNCKEGDGNESIFGKTFEDHSTQPNIHHAGTVSLAVTNGDNESYGSQFIICVNRCKELDGKNIVIGEVTKGLDVVRRVEAEVLGSMLPSATSQSADHQDNVVVFIKECGQLGYTGPNFEESVKEQFQNKKQAVPEPVKSRTCLIL